MDILAGPAKSALAHGRPSHGSSNVAANGARRLTARVHRCANAAFDLSSALGPPNGLAACPTGFAGRCLTFSAWLQFQFGEAANTQWVVNVYTEWEWEEHYRGALGAAIGCDKAETRSKYFADLGRMRQDYARDQATKH
jgi:hypothetical protein